MAEFTAKDVQELRQATGAGMMDCKKALEENDGDMEAAKQWLREKGLAASPPSAPTARTPRARVALVIDGDVGCDGRAQVRDRLRRRSPTSSRPWPKDLAQLVARGRDLTPRASVPATSTS